MSKEIKSKDQIIHEEFGLSISAPDLTPMDKGECKRCMEAYHSQFTTPSTTVEQASKEMDKAIKCLALELPELVWNDVSRIWENYKSVLAGAALASTPCNDWISVDSGLPEYGELVWVFNPKAVVKQYSIFFMPFAGAEEIGVFTNGGTMNDTDVTHWMKLPAPPAKQ